VLGVPSIFVTTLIGLDEGLPKTVEGWRSAYPTPSVSCGFEHRVHGVRV
jgi:hypothetical protein